MTIHTEASGKREDLVALTSDPSDAGDTCGQEKTSLVTCLGYQKSDDARPSSSHCSSVFSTWPLLRRNS